MDDLYLDEKYNILYRKNKSNFYEPIAIEYNIKTNECKLIASIPYLFDLIRYINFVRRKKNPKDGSFRILPLFIYQYSSIIHNIIKVMNPKSERILNSWSRQSGKSEGIKLTLGYLQTFGMLYLETKLDRFASVLASYDMKSVKKLFRETKPYILKGVELFNTLHTDSPLLTSKDNPKIENNLTKMELNRMVDDEELAWSHIFAITTGTTNDSLSCNAMIVDEAGLIDNEGFEVSSTPFTTATNAPILMYGLPCQIASSFLFQSFINNTAEKIIHTWEEIYKMRLLTDVKMAEGYKLDVQNRMKNNEKSAFIRWNYYCDFEDSTGKFITRKLLNDNKCLTERIEVPKNKKDNWLVCGVDISPKHDYFCITISEVLQSKFGDQIIKIKYMKTLNRERQRKSMRDKCLDITKLCEKFKIDILCVDSTSQQLYFIQELVNVMQESKCRTQLFPYPYSANGKEKLFGYLETMLYDQRLKLLVEDESWESEKLVEEMLYLKKEKRENRIFYGAPEGSSFSDDHVNSLALCNIGYQYAFESTNSRKEFDDGEHVWRPRLTKYIKTEVKAKKEPRQYFVV